MQKEQKLEDLPNIGSVLAVLLHEAGINTPADLFNAGSMQAFTRIKAIDNTACICKLNALEGAVEGIRWHNLSKAKKSELKEFFTMLGK